MTADQRRGNGFINLFRLIDTLASSGRWMSTREVADKLGLKRDLDYRNRWVRRLAFTLDRCGIPVEIEKSDTIESEGRLRRNGHGFWHYRLRRQHMERWLREIL